jgi:hypothetical protein
MNRHHARPSPARTAVAFAFAALVAAACSGSPRPAAQNEEPAAVELVAGSEDLYTITLTQRAAERLDIRTTPASGSPGEVLVPYSSVFYGPNGETWVYVSPASLTYVREAVTVADVRDGAEAVLSQGPQPGTTVVTVGAAELYGTEFEVGH